VPEVSRFFGIIIAMFYEDHDPPHFHVRYAEYRAKMGFAPLQLLDGSLPPRALGLVVEWALLHKSELGENWQRARSRMPLVPIAPLD
jgi:hypothetical protein